MGPFFPLGMRLFYGHSMFPNGIIRFETKKCTYGAFNFTGEMLIVSGIIAMFTAHALLLNDHKRFPKLGERPASNLMYHHLNVCGIIILRLVTLSLVCKDELDRGLIYLFEFFPD